jgi:hypothetical protein
MIKEMLTNKKYMCPERQKEESFEAYKVRRCSYNLYIKELLVGKVHKTAK